MIINFFGIQLQVIDNGDGTFDIRPVDAVADKQIVRAELARLREEKAVVVAELDTATTERDYHVSRRDSFVSLRNEKTTERDALNATIAELKAFLESAGDVDA